MPLSLGFVPAPPTGEAWLHEIKHDGFRVVARKEGESSALWPAR
jgi:ATP-dependent DNA ligase